MVSLLVLMSNCAIQYDCSDSVLYFCSFCLSWLNLFYLCKCDPIGGAFELVEMVCVVAQKFRIWIKELSLSEEPHLCYLA